MNPTMPVRPINSRPAVDKTKYAVNTLHNIMVYSDFCIWVWIVILCVGCCVQVVPHHFEYGIQTYYSALAAKSKRSLTAEISLFLNTGTTTVFPHNFSGCTCNFVLVVIFKCVQVMHALWDKASPGMDSTGPLRMHLWNIRGYHECGHSRSEWNIRQVHASQQNVTTIRHTEAIIPGDFLVVPCILY